jgi:hypothetical protein
MERKQPWRILSHCYDIYLEGLRKTTKNVSQASRSPDSDQKFPGGKQEC